MKTRLLASSMLAIMTAACATTPDSAAMDVAAASPPPEAPAIPEATSAFAELSTLPFHAPDFTALSDADYQPAIEEAIAIKLAEIDQIANNPAPPTFANTIVAMERAGQVYARATAVFDQKVSADVNDTLADANQALAPQRAALSDAIYLNPKLFARVKAIYDNRAAMSMTPEDAMLLELTYADFEHNGALLSDAAKAQLKQINGRLSELTAQIQQRITEGQADAALVVDTKEELSGLSDGQIAAAAAAAEAAGMPGKYMLAMTNTTSHPMLAQLNNRATRERLYRANSTRNFTGDDETVSLIQQVMDLRTQIAGLFGTPDYATWQMYDRMAKTPERAIGFMEEMVQAVRTTQDREAADINAMIKRDGGDFTVQPWDWPYYAEKIRQERYALDNEAIKQYFVVDKVLEDGVFFAANKLYGLTFKKRDDIPVYAEGVSVYTVFDADGSELALFYFDPFQRDSKSGGAWMNNFVEQSNLLGLKPVIANTLNVAPPAPGQPALATWDDVTTMFHEFGHALHGMFAHQEYPSISGTNTARDWVEFPSQFNEPFAADPEVLQNYAKHWKTGETIPMEMVEAIKEASKFNQGYDFGELLTAQLLDMKWHSIAPGEAPTDVLAFQQDALDSTGLRTDLVPPRYYTPYFRHIFGGYQAGYYAYTWTNMLAKDGYAWVEENGGMTRANGDHIRATFLGEGHTKSYGQMFRAFTGHDPEVGPLLDSLGLTDGTPNIGSKCEDGEEGCVG